VCQGLASNVTKDLWSKIKSMLGWQAEPTLGDLAQSIALKLEKDAQLVSQIISLLKAQTTTEVSAASVLVSKIDATKVVVAHRIDVAGDLRM